MSADRVPLRFGSPVHTLRLRGLRGEDEEAIVDADAGTAAALALIDALILSGVDERPPRGAELTTADRDRVLAAIYIRAFGARISSSVRCVQCEARFDVDFSLRDLMRDADEAVERGTDAVVRLSDGRRYRLPTGADERAALASDDPAAALLNACALDGVKQEDGATVPALMQKVAPLLDVDLDATCPECSTKQSLRFDVQSYLLAALRAEEAQLLREVHRLAVTYGWSRAEILALPRERRRSHAALIEAATRLSRRARA